MSVIKEALRNINPDISPKQPNSKIKLAGSGLVAGLVVMGTISAIFDGKSSSPDFKIPNNPATTGFSHTFYQSENSQQPDSLKLQTTASGKPLLVLSATSDNPPQK